MIVGTKFRSSHEHDRALGKCRSKRRVSNVIEELNRVVLFKFLLILL